MIASSFASYAEAEKWAKDNFEEYKIVLVPNGNKVTWEVYNPNRYANS